MLEVLKTLASIALINAAVWGLFLWHRRVLMAKAWAEIERAGESWVIPPQSGYYHGMLRGIISAKTAGAMGLTDSVLIFIPPLGGRIEFALKDMVGVSDNTWFAGNYRIGRLFLILEFANGRKVGFQVDNHQRWMQELKSRIPSAPTDQ